MCTGWWQSIAILGFSWKSYLITSSLDQRSNFCNRNPVWPLKRSPRNIQSSTVITVLRNVRTKRKTSLVCLHFSRRLIPPVCHLLREPQPTLMATTLVDLHAFSDLQASIHIEFHRRYWTRQGLLPLMAHFHPRLYCLVGLRNEWPWIVFLLVFSEVSPPFFVFLDCWFILLFTLGLDEWN